MSQDKIETEFKEHVKRLVYRKYQTSCEKQQIILYLRNTLRTYPNLISYIEYYKVGEVYLRKDSNNHILTSMNYL